VPGVTYTEISYEVEGHVGVLTLRRPEARNALTFTTYAELEDAIRTTTERCVIITGEDPAFCSGDDVKQIMVNASKQTTENLDRRPRLTPAADALLHTDVPVIAAVNGAAVGWGMELALMADIRVASEKAKMGELFVKRGLVSDAPGLGRLAQIVGRERAAELLFTGEIIVGDDLKEWGLVSRVVAHDQLLPTAMEVAQKIADNPPLAVQALKHGLRKALDPDWNDLGTWVSSTLGRLFQTEDHKEGVASFLEKRPAQYVGR
jgi:enoyl-CoA hydratase/carnithine racemase